MLIVDDSVTMRRIVAKLLQELGITDIEEAADGDQCVLKVASGAYSLVLLDWNMPNMLGIDALKAIRASGNKVPVIMVTTESEKRNILEAIKSGANNYITKPFEKEALQAKIKLFLGDGAAQAA